MSVHQAGGASYDSRGRLLRHTHDSVARRVNPEVEVLPAVYIVGDADTDGSIRMVFQTDNRTHLESRVTGVWNSTELELSDNSLLLGHNFAISAVGDSLQTKSVEGNKAFLGLDIPFADVGTEHPRTPIANSLITRFVIQPIFSTEVTAISHTRQIDVQTFAGFGFFVYLKVGATAATDDVKLVFTDGLIPGGPLLFERNYPAADFPANTEIKLSVGSGVGFAIGEEALMTVSSPAAFSLLGSVTEMFFAMDFQTVTHEDLVMESMIVDNALGHVFDNTIHPVYHKSVFF